MQTVIRVEKLSKTFNHNKALHAVDLTVQQGDMVALLGPSGSGKSTLLRHLSGLITGDSIPESHVELLGNTVQRAGRLARDIRKSRAQTGCIFQQFNLVNRLTVLENVLIGALGSTPFWRTCLRWFTPSQKQEALQALTRVGMGRCQGRMCTAAAAELLAAMQDKTPAETGRIRAQAPVKPIPPGFGAPAREDVSS